MPRKARQYAPIWARIKEQGSVTLAVAPSAMPTVKKAVIKEKDQDNAFKLMNEHDFFRLVITYDSEKRRLKFELKQRFGLEERVVV